VTEVPLMSRMLGATTAVLVLGLLTPVESWGQQATEGLEGAWRVTEITTSGPAARTLTSPQPGLLLFTGRHYSYTLVTGDEPRPDLGGGLVSATDLLTIWNPFTANAGTYEVSGSRMVRRPIVAKSPDAMAPGAFNEYTFVLTADTLWITTAGTETGPARNPTTVKYLRVR
jgi:hypothetical protein